MTPRAVWAIGLGQCVSWGVLYYAFSVLIVPVERELGAQRWVVVGAFSVALLVSAAASPRVGTLVDRGHGPFVVQAGGLTAAGLLAIWAMAPSVALSYLVWAALGLCMSAVLYEPIFAIVGKAIEHAGDRLRSIATITVFGGFASTVFLPLTGALVDRFGWRAAVGALAALLAITTVVVHRLVLSRPAVARSAMAGKQAADSRQEVPSRPVVPSRQGAPSRPWLLMTVFTCSSFVSAALATNLVPALIDRQLPATTAAMFASLFGIMQLPGRLLFMRERRVTPRTLILSSLGLQVAGLAALASSGALGAVGVGVALFACGSGLATLARPYLVLVMYGAAHAGYINGFTARGQQLARAVGPVAAAALAGVVGYGWVFAALGLLVTVAVGLAAHGDALSTPKVP
jgi:MFS family permease